MTPARKNVCAADVKVQRFTEGSEKYTQRGVVTGRRNHSDRADRFNFQLN